MTPSPVQALKDLAALLRKAAVTESIAGTLVWDECVNLPAGAADFRGEQRAALDVLAAQQARDPQINELLSTLEVSGLADNDPALAADLRYVRESLDSVMRTPDDLIDRRAKAASAGYHAWLRAREANDFSLFADALKQNLELEHESAACQGLGDRPYDNSLDNYDSGMTVARLDPLFAQLKRELVPLAQEIATSPGAARARDALASLHGFSVDKQRLLIPELVAAIGFDLTRGRLDVSPHPFCMGVPSDVRLTLNYDADKPLDAIYSALHEAGHGLYSQGLDESQLGMALGDDAGMGVHESQSRLWENMVGRSLPFLSLIKQRLDQHYPDRTPVALDQLRLAAHATGFSLIRTEADEVTYNLHILLRFELEKRLFSGQLAVKDLPEAWRALSAELLGLTPKDDNEGVLQDMHWSDGSFGYFPSYTLGNMLAAQLWSRYTSIRPNWSEDFARGDFSDLLGFLRANVHAHGARYDLDEVTIRATGEALSPKQLIADLRSRYGFLLS